MIKQVSTKSILITLIISIFSLPTLKAQDLEKAIAKIKAVEFISYSATKIEKDLFSDKIDHDTLEGAFDLSQNKRIFRVFGISNADWNDGNKLIRFYIPDKTYRIAGTDDFSGSYQKSVPQIMQSLEKNLKDKAKIHQLKDSVIAQRKYAHYKVVEFDSLKNDKRVYRHKLILIDRGTSLPFYYREDQQGFVDGTDMHLDHFVEYKFANYKLDVEGVNLSPVVIPDGFNMEVPKKRLALLKPGVEAPELALINHAGQAYQLKQSRGKLVLLNFSLVGCPHCIKSIEMLNELHNSLKKEDFEIITIHALDDKDAVTKMSKKFNVKYPNYDNVGNPKVNIENYHVDGYPAFYLIDRNGLIIKGFSGYSQSIGEDIKKLIEINLRK